jgi:hypothetical protein
LIEGQKTNLYTNSQNFTTWGLPVGPYTFNGITAPDGTQSGFVMTSIPNVATALSSNDYSYTAGATYTRSIYAKTISGVGKIWWQLSPDTGLSYYAPNYDLINGVVLSNNTGTASIVNAGNGWWRLIHTFTVASSATSIVIGDSVFIGGYGSGPTTSTVAVWGPQMEKGLFSTSYIPTASASATRAGDTAYMSGQNFTSWNNPSQGTYFVEGLLSPNYPNFASVITTRDSPGNNYITLYQYIGQVGGTLRYGNNIQIGDPNSFGATNTGTFYRQALTYKSGSYYSTYNNATSAVITDTRVPFNIDRMYIGGNSPGDGNYNSVMRRIVYYPTQLTTATMLTLTSSTFI